MVRKGIALLLSALLVSALALPAGAAAVNPFSDVSSDHWAYEAIVRLANAGLIEGYPDGTFGGDRSFTRYEMAMVFARILARFEALIEQKIEQGIDARTSELAREIEETRRALTKLLQDNFDELAARIARLEEGGVLGSLIVDEETGEVTLSPEVRAALANLVAEELEKRLGTLNDLDSLARRVLRLEGSTPSRSEVELIAQRVIADALADNASELSTALNAVRGDANSLVELLNQKVDTLARNMERLADEFQNELRLLGVRVASLEQDVDYLMERSDNLVLTVKNETSIELPTRDGAGPFYVDPRNRDLDGDGLVDEFSPVEVIDNRLTLNARLAGSKELSFDAGLVSVTDVVAGDNDQFYYVNAAGNSGRLGFGLDLSGELNVPDASLGRVSFDVPLGAVSLGLKYGAAGQAYPDLEYLGRPLISNLEDWLVNYLDPESDYVGAGEARTEVSLSASVAGAGVTVAAGRVDRSLLLGDVNAFTQVRVDGLEFAGINTSVLYDNRVNQADETDQTLRAVLAVNLFGVDFEATVHQRSNEQAAPAEQEQRGSWLKASRRFDFAVPVTLDGRFGLNQELEEQYLRIGVGAEYPLGALRIGGGFSMETKALGRLGDTIRELDELDDIWWTNAPWNVTDDPRTVITFGATYTTQLLGADVELGYEYLTASVGNAAAGNQNTVRTAFERAVGTDGAVLEGELKLYLGGLENTAATAEGDRNEQDLVAKVGLTYPVFEGGKLTVGGEFVSSTGTVANEYQAYSLKGGLTVEF